MSWRVRALHGFFWVFLAVLFFDPLCIQGSTNSTNFYNSNYEAPPLRIGSIDWLNDQELMKRRQELYRKRIPIPEAVGDNVPRAADSAAANETKTSSSLAKALPPSVLLIVKLLFYFLIASCSGLLLLKKFAPDVLARLNQRLNPWYYEPLPELAFTEENVRSEEDAFAEFVAKFRASSPAALATGLTRTENQVKEFYAQATGLLNHQRTLLQDIIRKLDVPVRQELLSGLRARVSEIKELADFPEVLPVWQVAAALDGLLKRMVERKGDVTPSTLRTVTGGMDLLEDLCATALQPHLLTERPLKFLVVDDDLVSRHAMSLALKKAFTQPDVVGDAGAALASVMRQAYDVIFLDVQMPDMDGFELCTNIRATPLNRATPVVFVTNHNDFEARARSTLSGGNEILGKPFLTFEITLKALTLGMQRRLLARDRTVGRDPKKTAPPAAMENFGAISTESMNAILPQSTPEAVAQLARFTDLFLARAARKIKPLKALARKIHLNFNEPERQAMLSDGFLLLNSLLMKIDGKMTHPAYRMSVALEGLFRKLLEKPKYASPSTQATISQALEVLVDLLAPGVPADLGVRPPIELLVVDDDLVARRVIVGMLQTAFRRPESAEDGEAALALANEKVFDLILMDVVMPRMSGFEVCSKIRKTFANRTTPVVFVTAKVDADIRSEVTRNGGSDIVFKPLLGPEIIVKTLTFALRSGLQRQKSLPGQRTGSGCPFPDE